MNLNYPIYLTRVLSSLLVGVLIFALSFLDLIVYNMMIYGQICNIITFFKGICPNFIEILDKNILLFFLFFFLPICFFIGELFSDLSEIFIFDPIFNNARINKESFWHLEFVNPLCFKKDWYYISLLFPWILKLNKLYNQKEDLIIYFKDFNNFICKKEKNFSLSEMYFNMHRIMGGLMILFWILFVTHILLIFQNKCSIIFSIVNLILIYFCFEQGKKQRLFANRLIYFGSVKNLCKFL